MRALPTLLLVLLAGAALAAEERVVETSNAGFRDREGGGVTTHVPAGTTVVWLITGGVHTIDAYAAPFGTGTLAPGETYAHTFSDPGAFPYRCTLHLNMQGLVLVT